MILRILAEPDQLLSNSNNYQRGHLVYYTDIACLYFCKRRKYQVRTKIRHFYLIFVIFDMFKTSLLFLFKFSCITIISPDLNCLHVYSLHAMRAVCSCPHRLTTGLQLVMLCCLFQARLFGRIERKIRELWNNANKNGEKIKTPKMSTLLSF